MRNRILLPAFLALLLTGCAYPRVVNVYDDDCQAIVQKLVLDVAEVGMVVACSTERCLHALVAQVAGLAISAVVSGSIVVVGNVVYWAQRQRTCPPQPALLESRSG